MHVLFQVKVPLDLAQGMRERLEHIQAEHDKEVDQFQKKIKTVPDPTKLQAQSTALTQRGRRLTAQALVRAVLKTGYAAIMKMDGKTLLAQVEKDDVVRGRPALKLVGGVKRGG